MNKYFINPKATAFPLCESPFVSGIMSNNGVPNDMEFQLWHFSTNGFLKSNVSGECIDAVVKDMFYLLPESKTQEAGYHYNDSPRIFEGWKKSKNILNLSTNEKILNILRGLYGREPIPFQTINFFKGTNQPLHSDTIHFHTIPERWMCAAWVALEDISIDAGPLIYVPCSHKLPCYTFQDINLGAAEYGKQFDHYKEYETFIEAVVQAKGLNRQTFLASKGDVLIWAANLLHGGSHIVNPNLTRLSQVTHYYFEGCTKYYSPMFSDLGHGIISEKDLSTKKFV